MENSEVKKKGWAGCIFQVIASVAFFGALGASFGVVILHSKEIIDDQTAILFTVFLLVAYIAVLSLSWLWQWFTAPYRCQCGNIYELKLVEGSDEECQAQQMANPNTWKCPACKTRG